MNGFILTFVMLLANGDPNSLFNYELHKDIIKSPFATIEECKQAAQTFKQKVSEDSHVIAVQTVCIDIKDLQKQEPSKKEDGTTP